MEKIKSMSLLVSLTVAFCLVAGSAAFADCSSKNNTCYGKVTRVYVSGGTLYIGTDGDEAQLNCTSPAGVYVTIPTSDSMFDAKYATLLTAMSLGKKVGLRIVDNDANCKVSYIYMDN